MKPRKHYKSFEFIFYLGVELRVHRLFIGILFVLGIFSASFGQGTSWQMVSPLPQGNNLNAIEAVNGDTLVAVGDYGTIIRSSNAGATWLVEANVDADTDSYWAVQFMSPTTGWAAGDDGIVLRTSDGGITWTDLEFPYYNSVYGMSFTSSTTGWICGGQGLLMKTTDAGTTWVDQSPSDLFLSLGAMQFLSSTTGFAVGDSGLFIKTTNGGTSWSEQRLGTSVPLL
ncbi:MAG TPA: YCF48-related protein, partial [Bacteroidota bacterium]|nr:YCF48-related protein [Bacteroidota bacterium]